MNNIKPNFQISCQKYDYVTLNYILIGLLYNFILTIVGYVFMPAGDVSF